MKKLQTVLNKRLKQKKVSQKPLTGWAKVAFVFSLIAALYLGFPLILGVLGLILPKPDLEDVPATAASAFPLSYEALTGLIILAAALGGFILWFVQNPPKSRLKTESDIRSVRFVGKYFVYSALLLSLFLLLSPLIPEIRTATDFYDVSLKYIAVISLIGGGVLFAFANILGLIYMWRL